MSGYRRLSVSIWSNNVEARIQGFSRMHRRWNCRHSSFVEMMYLCHCVAILASLRALWEIENDSFYLKFLHGL